MRHVNILVSGTKNAAFYSQIAVLASAIRAINWRRWQPSIHAFLGGPLNDEFDREWRSWSRFLAGVVVIEVSAELFALKDNWAQVDAALERAPGGADAVILLDADTLPVGNIEDIIDRVADEDLVAGVIAHNPPPGMVSKPDWMRVADGIINKTLTFDHPYSLVVPGAGQNDLAPFYVNGGVMLFGRSSFERFVPKYFQIRAALTERVAEAFTGQVASTMTIAETGLRSWALPIRFNFPNDPVAQQLHPFEAANVVIHHYLRTTRFDRHQIFTTTEAFDQFMALSLDGPDRRFQSDVRNLFDSRYPFALA